MFDELFASSTPAAGSSSEGSAAPVELIRKLAEEAEGIEAVEELTAPPESDAVEDILSQEVAQRLASVADPELLEVARQFAGQDDPHSLLSVYEALGGTFGDDPSSAGEQ
jgi:hypothetical protein